MSSSSPQPAHRLARGFRFVAPVAIAAMTAALLAGLVEGIDALDGAGVIVAAIGFSAPYGIGAGLLCLLLGRGLWRAWRVDELLAPLREGARGATPRLAGWLTFLALAIAGLSAGGFTLTRWLARTSEQSNVVALGSALGFLAMTVSVLAISRPVVDGLTAGFRTALSTRVAWLLQPGALAVVFAALALVVGYLSWRISIVPRIGTLKLGVEVYLAVYVPTLVAGFALAYRFARGRTLASLTAGLALLCSAVIATSLMYRERRPFVVLDIWSSDTASGMAVDISYDLDAIRDEFALGALAADARTGEALNDVVLITIDTFRADQTTLYGGQGKMPRLAKLARTSTIFEWAFAPSNVTRRSIPAIITGLDPLRIRGRLKGWALAMDPRHIALAERFRAAGYDTAGFFCCDTHFDKERIGTARGIDHLVIDRNERRMLKSATKWLEQTRAARSRRPVFVWVHVYEPHRWHKAHKKAVKAKGKAGNKVTYAASYRKALTKTDSMLSPLLGYLERTSVRKSVVVALTSDHGEALGNRGQRFHSSSLYNAQIRVPLLLRLPDQLRAKRVEQPVSLIDLAPTLLDAAGFERPDSPLGDGQSLMPLARGQVESDPEAVVLSHQIPDRSVSQRIDAIVIGPYKLIVYEGKPPMLFDIVADPDEKLDLADEDEARVERMAAELEARNRSLRQSSPFP